MSEYYITNPYKGLFLSSSFIQRKKLFRVAVSRSYIQSMRKTLDGLTQQKRERCIHLYLFIAYCNGEDAFRLLRTDLQQSFVGVKAPTEKMISECTGLLESSRLIDVSYTVSGSGKRINSYVANVFNVQDNGKTETFEFGVSENLSKLFHVNGKDDIKDLIVPPSFDHMEPPKVDKESLLSRGYYDSYTPSFLLNYAYLHYANGFMVDPRIPTWQSDGRIHHKFHELSKEIRETEVMMDGEHITEVWDLHNAFFVLLYARLLSLNQGDTEDVQRFGDLVMSGQLYDMVQRIFQGMGYDISRDKVKEILNRFKNTTRRSRRGCCSLNWITSKGYYRDLGVAISDFNNGYMWQWLSESVTKHLVRCVDEYFERNFPTVRNYLVDYSTRIEIEEYITKKRQQKKTREKVVSNLQRDITPLEFRIISAGVCRTLYETYGIKSLTVHDAIYVRISDAERIKSECIDIDRMLLGEVEKFRPNRLV